MEASAVRPPRDRTVHITPPSPAERLAAGVARPVRGALREAGDILRFSGRAFLETRGVWRHGSEVLRQASILVVGSAIVIWFMQFVMGTTCATEGNYILRGYGASNYSGVLTAYCGTREMAPYMWGYILAAKVGCGLVAEIGSMRINEEIDAMESLGLSPMRYVVATRLVAAILVFPGIFIVGVLFNTLGAYMVVVLQIGDVSRGGWESVHWAFLEPKDLLYSTIKACVPGVMIVLVGMYYGYRAKGGPVGVGSATAKSMMVNLILIHLVGTWLTTIFWGLNPSTPIGG